VVAGLVEGFVTPSGQALGTVLTIGVGLGVLFWGGVFWLGRARPSDGDEPVDEAAVTVVPAPST
jgi:hypothetical protein